MIDAPIGFLMALAQNEPAMRNFAVLSDAEQARIIERARQANSRDEMRSLVEGIH